MCACVVSRCVPWWLQGHRGFGHTHRALLGCLLAWIRRRFGVGLPSFSFLMGMTKARQDKTRGRGHLALVLACLSVPVLLVARQALHAVRDRIGGWLGATAKT